MQGTFKKQLSSDRRKELYDKIVGQHSDRLPVIVEAGIGSKLKLHCTKYIVPKNISVGEFLLKVRDQTEVDSGMALFLFCGTYNWVLVPPTNTMEELYNRYKDTDGFLYLVLAQENTFGGYELLLSSISHKFMDSVLYGAKCAAKTFRLV